MFSKVDELTHLFRSWNDRLLFYGDRVLSV